MDAEPSRARRAHSCYAIKDVGNDKPFRDLSEGDKQAGFQAPS